MAEGESDQSLSLSQSSLGSGVRCDFVCDPCQLGEVMSEGIGFCTVCQEYLCTTCFRSHQNSRATRGHKIVQGSDIGSARRECPTLDFDYCSKHPGLVVETYCKTHDEVLCSECSLLDHRKCLGKILIQDASTGIQQRRETKNFTQTLNSMKVTTEELIRESNEELAALTHQNKRCLQKIADFREEINQKLDQLEKDIIEELKADVATVSKNIHSYISSLDTLINSLERNQKNFVAAKSHDKDHQVFIAVQKTNLKALEESLSTLQHDKPVVNVGFLPDETLQKILHDVETFGGLWVDTNTDMLTNLPASLKDKSLRAIANINLKQPYDRNQCRISGAIFLSTGECVLCDHGNSKIKLLDKDFQMQASIRLAGRPWDVAMVTSQEVVVSVPSKKQLQFILVPSLIPGRTLEVAGKTCKGLAVCRDKLFVTCTCNDNQQIGEVLVMDRHTGTVQRRIGRNADGTYMFIDPTYIAVDGFNLYVSDFHKNAVVCLTEAGSLIYRYRRKNLRGPNKLLVDRQGHVFVCTDSAVLKVVTPEGRKYRNLLTWSKDVLEPQVLCWRPVDNTLLIGMFNSNTVKVYRAS